MNNQFSYGTNPNPNPPNGQFPNNTNNMTFHQPSSAAAGGGSAHAAQPRSQLRAQPRPQPPMITIFIQNVNIPNGQMFNMERPADISPFPHMTVTKPDFPERRQRSLHQMQPCVFYVQYSCVQNCRSMGICVHFQFVLGCRRCPDGLRCDLCLSTGSEEAIHSNRKCPLHQNPRMANPIPSRPEDFLATPAQKEVCEDIITRSFQCRWDDLADTDIDNNHVNDNANANANTASGGGQAQPGIPAPMMGGSATGTTGQSAYALSPGAAYAVPNQALVQGQVQVQGPDYSQAQVQDSARAQVQGQVQTQAQNGISIDDMAWLNQHQV